MTGENIREIGTKEDSMVLVSILFSYGEIGYYVSQNGQERKGEWHDGRRMRWLDGDKGKSEEVPTVKN